MIDAIWSIADKVIWVNLEALPGIKYCVGLQHKEMRVGRHARVTFSLISPKTPAIDMTGTSSPAEEALLLMLRRGNCTYTGM